jgi:ABC-type transporter Mla maintaining outer membrane lipid asymmetry ATPase subunit MlaF
MLLAVKDLTVHHGKEVHLRDISFDLAASECLVIRSQILLLGTTLLQSLVGLEEQATGEVHFNGRDLLGDMPLRHRLELRRDIGYVHRVGGLISLLNVRENIALPLCYHAQVTRQQVAELTSEVAEVVGVSDLLDREVDELDIVQVRLVNLARALIDRPQLLLVDAILEGMDEDRRRRAAAAIERYQNEYGFGVVMTARTRNLPQTTRVLELRTDGLHRPGG